jgi:hypothetical protein
VKDRSVSPVTFDSELNSKSLLLVGDYIDQLRLALAVQMKRYKFIWKLTRQDKMEILHHFKSTMLSSVPFFSNFYCNFDQSIISFLISVIISVSPSIFLYSNVLYISMTTSPF